MPAAAGPIAPASTSQVQQLGVPNNGPNNVGPNNAQNVQPVMCQPVQPVQRQNKESQPFNVLDTREVLNAVESLYQDQLKPYGRILRKRLAEKAAGMGFANLDVDIKRLKNVCDTCPWIIVQAEEGGDWSALLCNRNPESFVDVYSPQDNYPTKMWQAAEAYFESLDDAHMVLPGGRYSCAQALVSRGLEFLSGRSLGQVCHIVQLAISQKKLLGYLNGAVVPYKRSQSMIKERCAEKQRPCTNTTRSSSSDLADWEKVKHGLKEILFSLSPGTTSIPLSNVKRLFRSRYHTELSETALGHSKLSELLQDPRLKDICHVRLQGHGYVVGPAGPLVAKGHGQMQMNCHQGYQGHQGYHQGGHQGHQGGHQGHHANQAHQSTHQQPLMQVPVAPAPQGGPKCGNMGMPHSSLGMHMGQVQSVAAAGAAAVSQAMRDAARPENKGNKFYATYDNSGDRPSLRDRAHFVPPLSMEDVETEAPPRVPWKPPSPAAGSLRSRRDHFEASGLPVDDMNLPGVPSTPLPLMPATPDTPGFPKWNRVTQTPEALRAYSPMPIHNTFINYPMPPPTPNPCQGRSQSLPRNLSRMEDEGLDWSKSDTLSSHPANRLMSAAAAAAGPGKAPHPISANCTQPGVSNSPGFHPQNYTNPGASTIRLADLL